ncbi:uncharacterized protein G2W53_045016 [Senna tora]|uniref:Uncharacterized protein n=1 Tax=Senna tora TaxID=362788 RepID=A0A834SE01_9FABA|nr:uncharacterized protein G2W53_045016 [Senna tora]
MQSHRIGNLSGLNVLMGLMNAWEVCQFMSKRILYGKWRLNLKRIEEAQIRMRCRTSGANRCVRVVLGIQVGLMVKWDS